jgi:hypothetical protein
MNCIYGALHKSKSGKLRITLWELYTIIRNFGMTVGSRGKDGGQRTSHPRLREAVVTSRKWRYSRRLFNLKHNLTEDRVLKIKWCNFCWYTWPKTYSNLSPCFKNGQWSPQNYSERCSQSATQAATVRGVMWKRNAKYSNWYKWP